MPNLLSRRSQPDGSAILGGELLEINDTLGQLSNFLHRGTPLENR